MFSAWQYDVKRAAVTGVDAGNCRLLLAHIWGKTQAERDAHGALVGVAPKLLDAAERALAALMGTHNEEDAREALRAAIAEARGKEA